MLKKLLIGVLLFYCFITVASAGEVVLNLDKPIKAELLLGSEYYNDYDANHSMSSIEQVPDADWIAFNRKQFRFGLTSHPIWVKTTLITTGQQERPVLLDLHGVIRHIQLQVRRSDGNLELFSFGKGSKKAKQSIEHSHNHFGQKAKTDHIKLRLLPGETYELRLRIKGNNAVIGSFRAIDPIKLDGENQTRINSLVAFLFLVFLVTFYSSVVYVTTHDKAFLFHALYVLSVTGYLLNSYGFLSSWLGIDDLKLLENLLIFSLASALLSVLAFCKAMLGDTYKQFPQLFKLFYRLFFLLCITTFCLVPFIPYSSSIRFLIVGISLAIMLSPFMVFYRPKIKETKSALVDTRLLRLRVTLLTFAIVGGVHTCTRLGLLNVYWFTNYILFIFIFIETILFAAVIFINTSNDKKAIFKEAYFDRQSQLPNCRALEKHFESNIQSKHLTLVYFWVSGFDKLEVSSGSRHYCKIISTFGEKLSKRFKDTAYIISYDEADIDGATLFHTGKNNFALLCERLDYKKQLSLHRQITDALNLTKHQNYNSLDFKIIMGADGFYPGQNNYETVTQNCLLALAQGIKNNTSIKYYDESMRANKILRRKLIKSFNEALECNEIFLLWQPQYDVKSQKVVGVEVFSRWEHPEYGLIMPNTFIPLLEKSNRICQLSRWVIQEVFTTLPLLHSRLPGVEVSINLSPRDIINSNFFAFLDKQLEHKKHLAAYIIFEITESIMIDDFSIASENITALQRRGFQVSIENFGSGLASFSFLQTIPTNELKVDKSFSDRFTEPKTYAILSNIIKLSKRMGIRLVIEGLETKQQIDLFSELGVERLQGCAISKPLALSNLLSNPSLISHG